LTGEPIVSSLPRAALAAAHARAPAFGRVSEAWNNEAEASGSVSITKSVGKAGKNRSADVLAVKQRLIDLGYNWIVADDVVNAATIKTIKLFQAIVRGYWSVSGTGVDGRIDPGGNTLRWLNASNAPQWQEMPPGSAAEGFHNAELADTADTHDFGTHWLAETVIGAGASYKTSYRDANAGAALLTINDASFPRGGNTPDHGGHETGLELDIRLPDKSGNAPGGFLLKDTAKYDQNAMRAMLTAFWTQPLVKQILFNDAVLIAEGLCTKSDKTHEHHAHIRIKPPALVP
jgi:peptidoglycan hydrolase-like protein with peptidoglycan-binding domain